MLQRLKNQRSLILSITLMTMILYLLAWQFMATETFFSPDNGMRFVQIKNLINHNWQTFAIDYPGQTMDPEFLFAPYYRSYSILNQRLYLPISPIFTLLSSWGYALWGYAGLAIVPVFCGLLTALAAYQLARLAHLPHAHLALWGSMFATPLAFYSTQIWDHTLAAACALWGVYGIAKTLQTERWLYSFLGGMALAFGTIHRPEIYIFALAVGVVALSLSPRKTTLLMAMTLGGVAGMLPFLILQYQWYGHPFAPVLSHIIFKYGQLADYLAPNRNNARFIEKIWLVGHIMPSNGRTIIATLLIISGWIPLIFAPHRPIWRTRLMLIGGLCLTMMGYLWFFIIAWDDVVFGLITSFPLLGLSLLYLPDEQQRGEKIYRLIFFTAALFFLLMVLLWPSYGGTQWGVRYMLPIYPLLCLMAMDSYDRYQRRFPTSHQTMHGVALTLLGLSLAFQLWGLRLAWWWHHYQQPALVELNALSPYFVITNQQDLATTMAATSHKAFLYTGKQGQQLDEILHRLHQAEVETVIIWPASDIPLTIPSQIDGVSLEEIAPKQYRFTTPIE